MTTLKTKSVSGDLPLYGAIFVANEYSRHECFERKLFGGPFSQFTLVKEIKAGMLLFLFEYETRRLYGVFQATTDGKLNIVPEAYKKFGRSYPSQVRFTVLWRCVPLYEHEFRGAIKENYFAPNKFNFGLSKYQVQALLNLFYSKKIVVHKPLTQNKGKRKKRSTSLDEHGRWGMSGECSLEEGEIENSETESPSHSTGASSHSSFSANLLCPSKKASENVLVSSVITSSDVEDFIPLPSLEDDELTETGEVFPNNQSESDNEELLLSEECIIPEIVAKDLIQGPNSNSCYESFPIRERETKLLVNGLYADNYNEKMCVFSRLNMVDVPAAEGIEDDLQFPDGLMRELHHLHKMWKKKKKDQSLNNKASAFLRLSISPKEAKGKLNMKPWEKPVSRNAEIVPREKKRRQSVFLRLENDRQTTQINQKSKERQSVFLRLQIDRQTTEKAMEKDPSGAKNIGTPEFACPVTDKFGTSYYMVYNHIPPQDISTGKEKGENCEEGGSTKSENAVQHVASQKEIVTRKDEEVIDKSGTCYYLENRHVLPQDISAGHEKSDSSEEGEGSTKSEISNGVQHGASQKEVVTRKDEEVIAKFGTYYHLVNNHMPPQDISAGKEKGHSSEEEGSTKSETANGVQYEASQKEVVTRKDGEVTEKSGTYYHLVNNHMPPQDISAGKEKGYSSEEEEEEEGSTKSEIGNGVQHEASQKEVVTRNNEEVIHKSGTYYHLVNNHMPPQDISAGKEKGNSSEEEEEEEGSTTSKTANGVQHEASEKEVVTRKDEEVIDKSGTHCYLVNNHILSQDISTGKEKSDIYREDSTKIEISNAVQLGISQKEVLTRKDQVSELSPKSLLTYSRRHKQSSASPLVQETKLSVGADEGQHYGGEDACNQLLGSENVVVVQHISV